MELVNNTDFQTGFTLGMDPDGRERVVVVVKGTFDLPARDEAPGPADEQEPLVTADQFTGEPGLSATIYEADFAPFKPKCDVLLNGSAYAPDGVPVAEVTVGLRVGAMQKSFTVVGQRTWQRSLLAIKPTGPKPFTQTPIGYDQAYGGRDVSAKNPDKEKYYLANPVGTGYYPLTSRGKLIGKSLPNSSALGTEITTRKGKSLPMAFGAIGRNFAERHPLAGTYDDEWLANVFPFLPPDFDPLYHQAAPAEQQIDYPLGGEKVVLVNVTSQGRTVFRLPKTALSVCFTTAGHDEAAVNPVIDTVIIEPDHNRFLMVWRASLPLQRDIFELKQCVVKYKEQR